MNEYNFKKIDAFATEKSDGNPAGCVLLENLNDISEQEMLQIAKELSNVGYQFNQIIQTTFKDKIKIVGNDNELDIEIDYKIDGAFSFITAKYYSNQAIWNAFTNAINKIKA